MAVDYKKLKVGDRVRYLGGDERDGDGVLIDGKVYEIIGIDSYGDRYFENDDGCSWYIVRYNAYCFELVDDKQSGSTCNCVCKHDSHIVNLAKEDAELKRELSELKEYVEKEAVLFDERLIEVETKKPGEDKTQYVTVYGSEYIDKLFGGDSE